MRILIISPTQSGIGGIAQHVTGLVNYLQKKGHEVDIISSENTFTIPIKGLKNPSFMISSFLKAKFKKNQDIIHAHNIPAALAMKNSTGKKILTLHGIFSQQIDELHGKIIGRISEKYEKDALNWADAITVVSKEAFNHYTKLGYNVIQIPNAIDLSSLGTKIDRRYEKQIIFAGRLSREKGTESLISIAKILPKGLHLVILGKGPEEQKIKALSKIHGNIHYLGYQSKENTISLIRGSDVLLQPSLFEGISSTLLEAMACKTPIVATNIGGTQELLENEKTAFLVEVGNHDKMLDCIIELFDDKEKTHNLTQEAYNKAKNYDLSIVGNMYLKLYTSLL
jgi:glycosyltransferase involved in cell wall biosynthesis